MLWHTTQICLSGLKHLFSQLPSAMATDTSQPSSTLGIAPAERNAHAQVDEPFPKLVILKVQTPGLFFFPHNLGYLWRIILATELQVELDDYSMQLHHCSTPMDSALLPSFPSSLLGIAPGNVLHCTSCMHTNICLRICLPRSQRHT